MQEDQNAMLHVMRSKFAMRPEQTGVGFWSLAQYSNDRRGTGERYWNDRRRALASRHGGQTEGQAVDPVFVGERQRDTFIWQRSARSLGGDDDDKFYPPLDYLFVYWLAEKSGSLQ